MKYETHISSARFKTLGTAVESESYCEQSFHMQELEKVLELKKKLSAPLRRGQANLRIIAFHPKEGHEDSEGHRCEDRTTSRRARLAFTEVRAVDAS